MGRIVVTSVPVPVPVSPTTVTTATIVNISAAVYTCGGLTFPLLFAVVPSPKSQNTFVIIADGTTTVFKVANTLHVLSVMALTTQLLGQLTVMTGIAVIVTI